MGTKNPCRDLRLPIPVSNTPSRSTPTPALAVKGSDVIISLSSDRRCDLHLTSTMLKKTSRFFRSALSDDWVHDKVTGHVDPGDGKMRAMKRFELEYTDDGGNVLVGKRTVTPPARRFFDSHEVLQSDSYRASLKRITAGTKMAHSTYPYQHPLQNSELERKFIVTANLLGFSMLCGFPLPLGAANHVLSDGDLGRSAGRITYLIQRLIQWIDYYGVLEAVHCKLAHYIMTVIDDFEIDSKPAYLRIASVLRDPEFFEWVLNKDIFYNFCKSLSLSEMDYHSGLSQWSAAFDKHLRHLDYLQRDLYAIDQSYWILPLSGKLIHATRDHWRRLVARSCLETISDWPIVGIYDSFFEYERADLPAPNERLTTQPLLDEFEQTCFDRQIEQWIKVAQKMILKWLTISEHEPFGFGLKLDYFFEQYGYPWDYVGDDELMDAPFSMIATNSLTKFKEDLRPSLDRPMRRLTLEDSEDSLED